MTIWDKSVLLLLLRHRLEGERSIDWQTLHKRDRAWFLSQSERQPWTTLSHWLLQSAETHQSHIRILVYTLSSLSLIVGFSVMAGLLEFLAFERINLLWFVLFAIALPFIWWLLALFFSSAQVPIPLRSIFEHRMPQGSYLAPLGSLIKQTVVSLGQQLSLLFTLGMLFAFLIYLLVTDLAFGWSSTLDLSAQLIHRLTSLLSWPWQSLWPSAVPSLELIEQTHYFRTAPLASDQPQIHGEWWRFLLMCLVVYVLIPRLITTTLSRLRLKAIQNRVITNDALISGLWQRMTTELINQEAEQVEQLKTTDSPAKIEPAPIAYPQVISWGIWPEEIINSLHEQLNRNHPNVTWLAIDNADAINLSLETLRSLSDEAVILLCKGWEPPTGELADFCQQLSNLRSRLFLWPVPLPGMNTARQKTLIQSWQAFMRQVPDRVHLITGTDPTGAHHD